ncbi:MAG: hypothetical protein V3R66_06135 [Rhodospirillales bacterium]
MAEDKKNSASSDGDEGENLAFEIMDGFVDHLVVELTKPEAVLSINDVRELAASFKKQNSPAYLAKLREYIDECLAQHEKDIWDKTRRRPFDRVLVKRFSHLFPAEGGLDTDIDALSRRILPGFFMAVQQMAGPELFDQCQNACKALAKAEQKKPGSRLHWNKLYDNAKANELVDDVFAVISSHFDDFDKRCAWLHDIIESHMAPTGDYSFEGESIAEWRLTTEHIHKLLDALFAPFRKILADGKSRDLAKKRYGQKACKTIEKLLKNIEAVMPVES